ncbi:MAG: FAD-dependent oxidoreductase [Candidatus Lokiarchaeota archaeon]|nr:FAD-dependent oxidoreductase [Candidatus Lokiarchaeota archaeon]
MEEYDVLVVGGGPGGLIAGKTASEQGLKTIVFERGRKCGEKNASGVGLVPKIWRDFPKIMKNMDLPSQRVSRMSTAHFCDETGEVVSELVWSPSKLNDYKEAREFMTVMVYRSQFDHWLANIAREAGVEIKTSTLITDVLRDEKGKIIGVIDEDGNKYKGIVIAADGAVSTIAHKSGIRSKFGPDQTTLVVNYDFEAPEKKIDQFIGDNCLHNWFCPLYPATFNFYKKDGFHIGLGQWYGAIDKNLLTYLNTVVKSPPIQRIIKNLNAKPRELHAHALPWMQFPGRTYTENVMLIGDAAGFPCPLEAEGIWHGMFSGKLAALNAKEAIEKSDFSKQQMKKYQDAWIDSPLGDEFIAGKELQEFWSGISFNTANIGHVVDTVNDSLNLFTGATSHVDMSRRFLENIRDTASERLPLIRKYILPYLARILEVELQDYSALGPLLDRMLDDVVLKRKKRGRK